MNAGAGKTDCGVYLRVGLTECGRMTKRLWRVREAAIFYRERGFGNISLLLKKSFFYGSIFPFIGFFLAKTFGE